MYTYYLIVNKSGTLSTVADAEGFLTGRYITTAQFLLTYQVSLTDANLAWLKQVWENCQVVGPGLPITDVANITDPTHTYLKLEPADEGYTIAPVELPYSLVLAYFADMQLVGISAGYERAKLGRFSSDAVGEMRWYDGKDFLLYGTPFVMRGESDGFTCAESETGDWVVESHTVEQVQMVGAAYAAWHQSLRTRFQNLQTQLRAATDLAQVKAVNW